MELQVVESEDTTVNGFVGVNSFVLNALNVAPSTVVIVYVKNSYIVAPITYSPNLKSNEIELKNWQRESLNATIGSYVKIQKYETKERINDLYELQPIITASEISIYPISKNYHSKSQNFTHSLLFNYLIDRFLLVNNIIIIPFWGLKYRVISFLYDNNKESKENIELLNNLKRKEMILPFRVNPSTSISILKSIPSNIHNYNNNDDDDHIVRNKTKDNIDDNNNINNKNCDDDDDDDLNNQVNVIEKKMNLLELKEKKEKKEQVLIGGLANQINQISEQLNLCFYQHQLFENFGLSTPHGILLFGPPGTGKTLIVSKVARDYDCTVHVINGPEIIGKYHGDSEIRLREIFQKAFLLQPSIIFIDEIDAICSSRDSLNSQSEKRIITQLISLFDQLHSAKPSPLVLVIAATNRPNSIDESLRRPGRFDHEIEIGIPNELQRRDILNQYLSEMNHTLSEKDIEYISSIAHGYVGADLAALCREASQKALRRYASNQNIRDLFHPQQHQHQIKNNLSDHIIITFDDLRKSLLEIKPSAMREVMIEVPKVKWSDIGGNDEIKQKLKEAVQWPLLYPDAFLRMGIRPPKGLLMYGPPGCSKTMMAKALATEAGLNFLAVKGPELFSKWVGESERAVREIFRKARAASPSIIFFDEIDALAVNRGASDGGGVADRVLSQLLTELDGIEPLKKVTIVAATNRPDILDKALLRPGRIDRMMYVGPPTNEARFEIFKNHCSKVPVSDDVVIDSLVSMTEGYSGAEVVAVCREASIAALEENIYTEFISMKHFEIAARKITPRITPEMISFYDNFKKTIKVQSI